MNQEISLASAVAAEKEVLNIGGRGADGSVAELRGLVRTVASLCGYRTQEVNNCTAIE